MQRKQPSIVIGICAATCALTGPRIAQASTPFCADGGGPTICVQFDNFEDPPQEYFDFRFYFTDPANPSVVLLRGRDPQGTLYSWRVWSWDAQENPANIGSITSPGEYDYSVRILQPDDQHAGADNVALIDLHPSDASKFSNIAGGRISGNLNGDLTLQESGGQGGVASFTIEGNAAGNITVHEVSSLTITGNASGNIFVTGTVTGPLTVSGEVTSPSITVLESVASTGRIELASTVWTGLAILGDLLGDITVTQEMGGGSLDVYGNVGPEADIEIADTVGSMSLTFNVGLEPEEAEFSGDLVLQNSVKSGQSLLISGTLTRTASLDFNMEKVLAGEVTIVGAQGGSTIIAGTVTGDVTIASDHGIFGGTAWFGSVGGGAGGFVKVCPGSVSGSIIVRGDVTGEIGVSDGGDPACGHLLKHGRIEIGGNLGGQVNLRGSANSGSLIEVKGSIVDEGVRGCPIPERVLQSSVSPTKFLYTFPFPLTSSRGAWLKP